MEFRLSEEQQKIRRSVREVCEQYPDEYWRELDRERRYPEEFVSALTEARWLGALIPEEYGGLGLGVIEASIILEEINRSGANGGACHAQMYTMGTLLRHGSEEQKREYLPTIRRVSRPQPCGKVTTTLSTGTRAGLRAPGIPT
jgi:acyl-CoA dehydrogenase